MSDKKKILWKLFTSALYISSFTFGGGYVIVSVMKKRFVDEFHWISEDEMLDLIAIAQSSPGVIAVNTSVIVGYRMAGIAGAIITVLGTVLPPLVILSVVSLFYTVFKDNKIVSAVLKGMQAGVTAVIADVVTGLGTNIIKKKQIISFIIMLTAFVAAFFFNINIILIILISGIVGAAVKFIEIRRNGDKV